VEKKHLPALAEVPEIAVAAVCRRTEAALVKIADRFRVPKRYLDYRALLDDRDIDAVLVATGPDSQPQILRDAAAAGKHVLVDKPLAATSADAQAILTAVRAAGIRCQVGFNKRYYAGYRRARMLMDSGTIGRPTGLSARFWYQPGRRDGLLYNGIHFLDLIAFFAGPVSGLSAYRTALPAQNGAPAADTVAITFTAGSAVGTVLLSSAASWDYLNEHLDLVGGDQGVLSVDNGRVLRVFGRDEPQACRTFENTLSVHWWSGNDEQGFTPQLRVFAQRVLGLTPSPADLALHPLAAEAEDGLRSLLVLEALRRSLAGAGHVDVPDIADIAPHTPRPQEAYR
jgi:myo-inositol 2-dehydrogenase/D-chiro-inositol 1-dehydrogenase